MKTLNDYAANIPCNLCGHDKHTTRCEEDAPNAQFRCACAGECPHGKDVLYCKDCNVAPKPDGLNRTVKDSLTVDPATTPSCAKCNDTKRIPCDCLTGTCTGSVVCPDCAKRWRVGSKVPLNVYEGDRAVCQCHNEQDARRIVAALNHFDECCVTEAEESR